MFSRNQQVKPPDPHRVSHLYLLAVAILMMSALFVRFGIAKVLPRNEPQPFNPLIGISFAFGLGFIYILLVALVLNRFGIRLLTSTALTSFQACWVVIYFIGLMMLLELVLG